MFECKACLFSIRWVMCQIWSF